MGIEYGWNIFISYTKMILSQEIIITTVKLQKKAGNIQNSTISQQQCSVN